MPNTRSPHTLTNREAFETNSKNHTLTVLLDNGCYRHLRMSNGDSSIFYWDVVTWPGGIIVGGDIADGWSLSRHGTEDMLQFVHVPYDPDTGFAINPSYWSEKLKHSQRNNNLEFSSAVFCESVAGLAEEAGYSEQEITDITKQAQSVFNEGEAYDFFCDNFPSLDYYDLDTQKHTTDFIYACYALATTAHHYFEMKKQEQENEANT